MTETIRVNFEQSLPLFPLVDTVLLPHAILPLHVFEPRDRRMVSQCLDRTGQIAIGTVCGEAGDTPPPGPRPVRTAACVGQIIQHDPLPDGRYNILLHGICRARIEKLIEPDKQRPFRLVKLAPIEPLDSLPDPMPEVREDLRSLLSGSALKRLRGIETLMEWVDRKDVPTHALIELIGFAVIRDTELKYQLLAEADPLRRAGLIKGELEYIDRLVHRADRQGWRSWPKGMSWN